MNVSASRIVASLSRTFEIRNHRTALWVACVAVLSLFLFLDIAIVARSMALVSMGHVAAALSAFFLMVSGLLLTIWEMQRNSHSRPRRR
jgi:hypothetical protein